MKTTTNANTDMRLMMTAAKGKDTYTVLYTGANAYEEAVEFAGKRI